MELKRLFETLKSARRIEVFFIAAILCIFLVLSLEGGNQTGVLNEEEQRMERILSNLEGAGKVSVMISFLEDGSKHGVVIASPGANDIRVMLELQRAAQTLTGLELEQIEIVKSKG